MVTQWFDVIYSYSSIHLNTFFSSCQAFRSKKVLASRIGLAWHTSLANMRHYTWQKYFISSSNDLFIQMQIGTGFFIHLVAFLVGGLY